MDLKKPVGATGNVEILEGVKKKDGLLYSIFVLQSLPKFKFSDSFSFSGNPKHFSNTQESIKVITEIIVSSIKNQHQQLQKLDQLALLIMYVFCGQVTEDVTSLLKRHNITLVLVPNNMTHIFQTLHLKVNKYCKTLLKMLFSEWFSKQMENGLSLEK